MKFWITFNEPWVFTVSGYGTGEMAPGTTNVGTDPYTAAHNVIKAHAETYHLYNDTYRATQNGTYSLNLIVTSLCVHMGPIESLWDLYALPGDHWGFGILCY